MPAPYFGSFTDRKQMLGEFAEPYGLLPTDIVLFAKYDVAWYDGCAHVLIQRDADLYEVRASHCSCDGLEHQWKPQYVTWKALALGLDEYLNTCKFEPPESTKYYNELVIQHMESSYFA